MKPLCICRFQFILAFSCIFSNTFLNILTFNLILAYFTERIVGLISQFFLISNAFLYVKSLPLKYFLCLSIAKQLISSFQTLKKVLSKKQLLLKLYCFYLPTVKFLLLPHVPSELQYFFEEVNSSRILPQFQTTLLTTNQFVIEQLLMN